MEAFLGRGLHSSKLRHIAADTQAGEHRARAQHPPAPGVGAPRHVWAMDPPIQPEPPLPSYLDRSDLNRRVRRGVASAGNILGTELVPGAAPECPIAARLQDADRVFAPHTQLTQVFLPSAVARSLVS